MERQTDVKTSPRPTRTDLLEVAINRYLTGRLAHFRAILEQEAEQPIQDLEVSAALLLSDLCRFIGLDPAQHDHVLGHSGVQHVLQVLDTPVSLLNHPSQVPDGAIHQANAL